LLGSHFHNASGCPELNERIDRKGKMERPEDPAVTALRRYIRVRTDHPTPDYAAAAAFLAQLADQTGLTFSSRECVAGKPVCLLSWPGQQPTLPAILLNSHTDVVPVGGDHHWNHPPFSGHKDSSGKIHGRGTQDMKSVGIQYVFAVARLMKEKRPHKRSVHICFVPDEEVGGEDGLAAFVQTEEFHQLNIGFGLDEGLASETDVVDLFYAERNEYWLDVEIPGDPGHGSRFVQNTAAEKARRLINRLLDYRAEQEALLAREPERGLGGVNTVNLTRMRGGLQANVVPDSLTLTFDIRLTPTTNLQEWERGLAGWLEEAGTGLRIVWLQKMTDQSRTAVTPDDPWYGALHRAFSKNGQLVRPQVMSAGTDARCVRELGIPAIGFSPMPRTPILLHDHNEFIQEDTFLRGLDLYVDIIGNLANV